MERHKEYNFGGRLDRGASSPAGNLNETLFSTGNESQDLEFHLKGAVPLAMCPSPDQTSVVVAGRDVLQVIDLSDSAEEAGTKRLRVQKNIKGGGTMSGDVDWNQNHSFRTYIATAGTSGTVALWDLVFYNKSKKNLQTTMSSHLRAVNTVRFLIHQPECLLSGSQDRTIIMWDVRTKSKALTFKSFESVRQVAVSPCMDHAFASAEENGVVAVWDSRNPSQSLLKFHAHEGPAYCVAWHPHQHQRLASGGRDCAIRIWNIKSQQRRRDHVYAEQRDLSIQTFVPVAKIAWRPNYPHQITSCGQIHDSAAHVWDTRRPHIPVLSFKRHSNVVTSLAWGNGRHVLVTCSKDGTIRRNLVANAHKPEEMCAERQMGASFSALGDLVCFGPAQFGKQRKSSSRGSSITQTSYLPQSELTQLSGLDAASLESTPNMLATLAKEYQLHGGSLSALCQHNRQVALRYGLVQAAHTWNMVDSLFGNDSDNDKLAKQDVKHTTSQSVMLQRPLGLDGDVIAAEDEHVETMLPNAPVVDGLPELRAEGFDVRVPLTAYDDEEDAEDDESSSDSLDDSDGGAASGGEGDGTGSEDDAPASAATEAGGQRHQPSAMLSAFSQTAALQIPLVKPSARFVSQNQLDANVPPFDADSMVKPLLTHYADAGDVQMCVTLMAVLGKERCKNVEDALVRDWFLSYCDLLDQHRLWNIRAFVAGLCPMDDVRTSFGDSLMLLTCGRCQRELIKGFWCTNPSCNRLTGHCAVCRLPVRGVYAWCQGCGHGGHVEHIKAWFRKSNRCPTGCGHTCHEQIVIRPFQPDISTSSSR